MNGFSLREYRAMDVPALSALWRDCFGDSEGFIKSFFAALPSLGGGVVAELDGEIIGAAYALNCQSLVLEERELSVGYIYGVGVDKRRRSLGAGAALNKAVYALSKSRGAEIVTTLPAEDSLYPWYESTIGLSARLYRRRESLKSTPSLPVEPLSPQSFALRREDLLCKRPHLRLESAAMDFEGALLREYGGGFFSVAGGVSAACIEDGRAVIKELICPPETVEAAAASVGAYLSAPDVTLILPAVSGEKYISSDAPLPAGCVWNLSFD